MYNGFHFIKMADGMLKINDYTGTDRIITIPQEIYGHKVYGIHSGAFARNTKIKEIIISEGINTIDEYAFDGCTYLKKITIPNTIHKIDCMAFNDCVALKDIYFNGTKKQWDKITKLNVMSDIKIHFNSISQLTKFLNENKDIKEI